MIEPHPSTTKIDQQVLTRIGKDSTQNMAPDLAHLSGLYSLTNHFILKCAQEAVKLG